MGSRSAVSSAAMSSAKTAASRDLSISAKIVMREPGADLKMLFMDTELSTRLRWAVLMSGKFRSARVIALRLRTHRWISSPWKDEHYLAWATCVYEALFAPDAAGKQEVIPGGEPATDGNSISAPAPEAADDAAPAPEAADDAAPAPEAADDAAPAGNDGPLGLDERVKGGSGLDQPASGDDDDDGPITAANIGLRRSSWHCGSVDDGVFMVGPGGERQCQVPMRLTIMPPPEARDDSFAAAVPGPDTSEGSGVAISVIYTLLGDTSPASGWLSPEAALELTSLDGTGAHTLGSAGLRTCSCVLAAAAMGVGGGGPNRMPDPERPMSVASVAPESRLTAHRRARARPTLDMAA
eukprot:COSAG01_NODE_3374_length_6176_cov_14.095904_1_plen_353_part_00